MAKFKVGDKVRAIPAVAAISAPKMKGRVWTVTAVVAGGRRVDLESNGEKISGVLETALTAANSVLSSNSVVNAAIARKRGGAVAANGKHEASLVAYIKNMNGHREELKKLTAKLKAFLGEVETLGKRIEATKKSIRSNDLALKLEPSYDVAISSWRDVLDQVNSFRDVCDAVSRSIWRVA